MLAGFTVVELCPQFPGPLAGQLLRQHGARVLKVVPSGAPSKKESSDATAGALGPALDVGKERLPIDVSADAGRAALHAALSAADVFLCGFRPGSLTKHGLGPIALRRRHPELVVCCLSGFGLTGPLRLRAGHDVTYLARSGVLGMMAAAAAPPVPDATQAGAATPIPTTASPLFLTPRAVAPLPVQVADVTGGTYPCVMLVLAALLGRERRRRSRSSAAAAAPPTVDGLPGGGSILDVSMTDNAHSLLVLSEAVAAAAGVSGDDVAEGRFLLCGAAPCYGLYRTRDGRLLAIGALEGPYWARVVEALGLPPELRKPAVQLGLADGESATALVAAAVARRTLAEWTAVFDAMDCMADPVLSPGEALSSALLTHRRAQHLRSMQDRGVAPAGAEPSDLPMPAGFVVTASALPELERAEALAGLESKL